MDLKEEFELLGLDISELDRLQDIVNELEQRLEDNRQETISLRPTDKGYDKDLARVSSIHNALTSQLEAARNDVFVETQRLKRQAIDDYSKILQPYSSQVRQLDRDVVQKLLDVKYSLQKRDEVAGEMDSRSGLINSYSNELRAQMRPPRPDLPWGGSYPGATRALEMYLSRFAKMAQVGNPPGDADVLAWFSRRVW